MTYATIFALLALVQYRLNTLRRMMDRRVYPDGFFSDSDESSMSREWVSMLQLKADIEEWS